MNRVFFSEDIYALLIASEWVRDKHEFSGLVYTQQKWIKPGHAIDDLELIALVYEEAEMRNQIIRIPL